MATPFLAGLALAAAALAGRYGVQAWQAFKARPPKPRIRKYYEGGFQPTMTKREAALILGIRKFIETISEKKKKSSIWYLSTEAKHMFQEKAYDKSPWRDYFT
ncbi:mitochondrial import inner membrane translocase subunit TIM14-1 isoform X2 [Vitis riparia]|uniref:mitochondrial import inner membrane translocase subunit TIM14-1 isoform X2 n=1 Tax=Vitis riparia TaxID=96939 RepID=UPI00155ABA6F|nr:mitochondrial import inner membrane translocase subunit TIM14-1 isoform X2 [Vitis riparia]